MNSVVYVDDEPALCRLMGRLLARVDADVRTFVDPEEAIASINEDPPSLIICDYRLGAMTGLALLARLTVEVPFALISGDLGVEDVHDPRVIDVLPKPIRPEELLAFVGRYL